MEKDADVKRRVVGGVKEDDQRSFETPGTPSGLLPTSPGSRFFILMSGDLAVRVSNRACIKYLWSPLEITPSRLTQCVI
jgi:hypothetical protein